jgi:hypothetical protein
MTDPRPIPDTVLVAYGLLTGGARAVLPPVWDLPFVRTVRGALFDRLARGAGVTLTAEARRVLADLEEPASGRGVLEQAVRWVAGRFLPGAAVADGTRNVLHTYGAGALFRRYLEAHRPEPRDPVLSGIEAENVRRALRFSISVLSVEHVRAIARLAAATFRDADGASEISLVQRYGDAVVATIAEVPAAWLDVLDEAFRAQFEQAP